MESWGESSARLGFVLRSVAALFVSRGPAPNVFARSRYREALVAPRLLRARD